MGNYSKENKGDLRENQFIFARNFSTHLATLFSLRVQRWSGEPSDGF